MVSIVLKDAYLQVPVHPDSRKYLRFVALNQVFQFKALCFGLSTAPQVFTRVMAPVSAFLHRLGIRMCRYLDDWLIEASSRPLVLQALETVIHLCQDLSIVINWERSNLLPSQSGISRRDFGLYSFQGFSLPAESREAVLNRRRIPVLRHAARLFVEKVSRNSIIADLDCSRRKVTDAIPSTSSSPSMGSQG